MKPTPNARSHYALTLAAWLALSGCFWHGQSRRRDPAPPRLPPANQAPSRQIHPDVSQLRIENPAPLHPGESDLVPQDPDAFQDPASINYWDLPLDEAVTLALQNSEVMRDLGGTVLRAPFAVPSVFDPAVTFTDPRFGEEAALSAFDATFGGRALFDKNNRVFNNRFLGTDGFWEQDFHNYRFELSKRNATGTEMVFRNVTDYDFNNNFGNRFGSRPPGDIGAFSAAWSTFLETEVRQPLLQGAGILFNRIAGPGDQPGVVNGVLVSRIRTDISLADFEVGIRDLISNVENAYWDLYYAYHDLHAKVRARNNALEAWVYVQNLGPEMRGGEADKLGQAEEQYWRFEAEVLDSLNGRLIDGTRTGNGTAGGTFRNVGGVRVAERRLRLMLGLPVTDTRLIRPADEPPRAPIRFDWDVVSVESLAQRPELRRQRWQVKQRELELLANRNYLLPQLDAIGRYRWFGLGQELVNQSSQPLSSAWGTLIDGDYQEWQLGVEFSVPLGFRQAHAAVRNAELQLARERAVLEEQKRNVAFGLSNAVGDLRRAYQVMQAQYNRRGAANFQTEAIRASYEAGSAPLNLVLESQRRQLDADLLYYQARAEYALAIKNVHFEKGTLLEYNQVALAEGPSVAEAYGDAARRRQLRHRLIDYVSRDIVVAGGPAAESALGPARRNLLPESPGLPAEEADPAIEMSGELLPPPAMAPRPERVPGEPQSPPVPDRVPAEN
jgi:hypothetical protein